MAEGLKIKIFGDAKDLEKALQNLKTVGVKSLNGIQTVGEKTMKSLATVGTASIGAITAGLTASVKAGKDFEQTFAKASTLFGDVNVQTDKLKANMLAISSETGVAAKELNEALYSALSAGVEVTEDMQTSTEFLSNSSKLAKAGFTDVETAISATAKTLNAYNLPASEASKIQNMLIQTQNKGITTVDELGQTLAQVTPTASAFGVAFDQVSASLSTMTAQGTPTAQATTQLNSLIAELGKNGTVASDNLKKAAKGSEYAGMSFKDMMDKGANLGDVLSLMNKYASASGVSLVDMFSSIEAGKAALSIMTKDGAKFDENLKAMADSAGLVDTAYDKMSNTLETQLDRLKQSVTNLGIAIYEENNTVFAQMANFGAECISKISEGFEANGTEGMVTALGNVLSDVLTKTTENLPLVFDISGDILSSVVDGLDRNLSKISEASEKIISSLKDGITNFMPKLQPVAQEIGNILVQGIIAYKQVFWTAALNVVSALAQGIAKNSKKISKQAVELINSIVKTATDNVPLLIKSASDILTDVLKSLAKNSGTITANIKVLITQICKAVSDNAPQLIQAGVELIRALIKGIVDNAGEIIKALLGTIGSLLKELGKVSPLLVGIGAAVTANFVATKIMSVVSAIKAVTAATEGATIAQKLLNATQLASPIGWITLGIGALATAVTSLVIANDDATESTATFTKAQQDAIDTADKLNEKLRSTIDAYNEQVEKTTYEYDYYGDLADELDNIVDKNGKIKSGYEDRAKVITNELSKALDIEIDLNNDVIDGYKELQKEIKNTTALKEAQELIDSNENKYKDSLADEKSAVESLSKQWTALNNARNSKDKLESLKNEVDELSYVLGIDQYSRTEEQWDVYYKFLDKQKELNEAMKEHAKNLNEPPEWLSELDDEDIGTQRWYDAYRSAIDEIGKAIDESEGKVKESNTILEEAQNTTTAYTKLQEAVASGNLEAVKLYTKAVQYVSDKHKEFTLENLQEDKVALEEQVKTAQKALDNHEKGAKEVLEATQKDLDEINKTIASKFILDTIGEAGMSSFADGIKSGKEKDVNRELELLAGSIGVKLEKAKDGSYKIGNTTSKQLANGIQSGKTSVEQASQAIASSFYNTLSSAENLSTAESSGAALAAYAIRGLYAGMSQASQAVKQAKKQQKADRKQQAKEAEKEAEEAAEEARQQAEEQAKLAKEQAEKAKKLAKERKQLIKDANKTVDEAYKNTKDKLSSINKEHKTKLKELEKEYKSKLKSIEDEYTSTLESIKSKQDSYRDKIMSFSDLFGMTSQNDVHSKDGVLANLAYTTTQYEEFYKTLETLKKRGISQNLLEQFTDLGVGYTAQLKQIASMDNAELASYQNMLDKQMGIANKIAEQKYIGEKQAAEAEYDKKTAKAIADYESDVKAQNERYKKQIKKLTTDTENYMEKLGKQLKKGLKKGSKMSNKEAEEIAEELVGKVVKKCKKKLKINSPSKVMEFDIAGMMTKGLVRGLTGGTKEIIKSAETQVDKLNKAYDNISVANKLKTAFAKAKSAVGANLNSISANIAAGSPTTIIYNNCNNTTNNNEHTQNVTFEDTMQAPDEVARALKYNNLYGLGGNT